MNHTIFTIGGHQAAAYVDRVQKDAYGHQVGDWHRSEVFGVALYMASLSATAHLAKSYRTAAVSFLRSALASRSADLAKHRGSTTAINHAYIICCMKEDIAAIQRGGSIKFKSNSLKSASKIYHTHIAGREIVYKL